MGRTVTGSAGGRRKAKIAASPGHTESESSVNAALSSAPSPPLSPPSPPRPHRGVLVGDPSDAEFLSGQLCIIRSQLEYFCATPEDSAARQRKGGTLSPLAIGRVGLRCIHCAHIPSLDRPNGAVTYPKNIGLVNQAVRNWQRYHFSSCPYMPLGVKDQIKKCGRKHSGAASLQHWTRSCEHKGLVNVEGGGGFKFREGIPPPALEPASHGPLSPGSQSPSHDMSPSPPAHHPAVVLSSGAPAAILMETGVLPPSDQGGDQGNLDDQTTIETFLSSRPLNPASDPVPGDVPLASIGPCLGVGTVLGGFFDEQFAVEHSDLCKEDLEALNLMGYHKEDDTDETSQETTSVMAVGAQPLIDKIRLAWDLVRASGRMRLVPGGSAVADSPDELFSLGFALYQHFTGYPPEIDARSGSSDSRIGMRSVKRERTRQYDCGYTPLRDFGFPGAICDLIANLLEGRNGPSGLALYSSIDEVETELRRMTLDPERHLYGAYFAGADGANAEDGKLHFLVNNLYGRRTEIKQLFSGFERVVEDATCEFILVSGKSGTGKSALVEQMRSVMSARNVGYFVSGKYDVQKKARPLFAISTALGKYCDMLLMENSGFGTEIIEERKKQISDAIGTDGKVLVNLIPSLAKIIDGAELAQVIAPSRQVLNQLMFFLRIFVQTVATQSHPLVLFLDDLHWADQASLEFIRIIVNDEESQSLLIVGCYRDNEVTLDHPLALERMRIVKSGANFTEIKVGILKRESVNEMVSDLLLQSPQQTQPLADLIHNKTGGNAYYVIQFLQSLEADGLLQYSFAKKRWLWYLERIQAIEMNDNAVELVKERLLKLDPDVVETVKVVSCFGADCEEHVMRLAFKSRLEGDQCMERMLRHLDLAVSEGILCKSDTKFSFSHYQLQSAAYSLMSAEELKILHLKIGQTILSNSDHDALGGFVFTVADQLRRGLSLVTDDTKRYQLAEEIFLRAGTKAMNSTLFSQALVYFRQGIELLGVDHWITHYQLSLKLYSNCVLTQFVSGETKGLETTAKNVLEHARSLPDKLCVYFVLTSSFGVRGMYTTSLSYGFKALSLLGEYFVMQPDPEYVFAEYRHTNKMLSWDTIESISALPVMEDENKCAAMDFMNVVLPYCHQDGQFQLVGALVISRMIRLTLKYGLCKESAVACASFGALSFMKKLTNDSKHGVARASQCGRAAVSIVKRLNAREVLPRVYSIVYSYINPIMQPMQANVESLKIAYDIALATGNVEYACEAIASECWLSFFSGSNLAPTIERTRTALKFMEEIGSKRMISVFLRPLLQTMLNLHDLSIEGPAELAMHEHVIAFMDGQGGKIGQSSHKNFLLMNHYLCAMILSAIFNENELAVKMFGSYVEAAEQRPNRGMVIVAETFYKGLVAASACRLPSQIHKKGQWREIADDALQTMKLYCNHTLAWNFQSKVELLCAEIALIDGDVAEATRAYQAAIQFASNHRFCQEEALACERAGMFFMATSSTELGILYLKKAHACWVKFGAHRKAEQLAVTFQLLLYADVPA